MTGWHEVVLGGTRWYWVVLGSAIGMSIVCLSHVYYMIRPYLDHDKNMIKKKKTGVEHIKMNMELNDIARHMLPIIDFRYITADKYSVKLWDTRPSYDNRSRSWHGDSCVCMLDLIGKVNLEEYRVNKMISYSRAIKEVI